MEMGESRPWLRQNTLEAEVPLPLYSDQYIKLWGPHQAPLLKQAVRWKTIPMGWGAVGQSWSTGLGGKDKEVDEPWYTLTSGIVHGRWQRAHAGHGEWDPLCPAYAQSLREVAWWDPIMPSTYRGPRTRWGSFLWQEWPILGKEYAATRSQSPWRLGGSSSGYVPVLSFCHPLLTTRDISTWSRLLQHQPSTHQ